jgi:DNA-binding FadR family transcriptional regulator
MAELVAASIREAIIGGEIVEGDFLPSETQLMRQFGASRPTIREAIRILENELMVSVVRGSHAGARIHPPTVDAVARLAAFTLRAQGTTPADISLARSAVLALAAQAAAVRCTPLQIASLRDELNRASHILAHDGVGEAYRAAAVNLQQTVLDVAGNDTLSMISAMLQIVVEQHMPQPSLRAAEFVSPPAALAHEVSDGLRSFGRLFDLMQAHDPVGVAAFWLDQIQNANLVWLLGSVQSK